MNKHVIRSLAVATILAMSTVSANTAPLPKDVPPVLGIAVAAHPAAPEGHKWSIRLAVPKVTWQVVGRRLPKKEWPVFKVTVEEAVLTLPMGYHPATQLSDHAQNRILDMTGKRLGRDEALKHLASRTPVLVSVSGRMPDPFYLQCTRPDTLIVVLGIPTSPAPELLPSPKGTRTIEKPEPDKKRSGAGKTLRRRQTTSFKGWELYIWEHEGKTLFSLMVGTNLIKPQAHIAESAIEGFEAIKNELVKLKKGESVFIYGRRFGAKAPAVPAEAIIKYCKKIGLKAQ